MNTVNISDNKQALLNIEHLPSERRRLGLSRDKLAFRIGLSKQTIVGYELGLFFPVKEHYNALAEVFGWDKINEPIIRTRKEPTVSRKNNHAPIVVPSSTPHVFSFIVGKCYHIGNSDKLGDGKHFTLRYEGRQGIHHVFREVIGGWITTRTDVQLFGVKIKEANCEG